MYEMVEAGGRTSQSFGLTRLFGQIYMYLYLSRQLQSLDDVAQALGVSKASVSIAARQLESWGAVRRVWKRGDRRDYYEAEMDIRRLISQGVLTSVNKKLESARNQIARSIRLLEEQGGDVEELAFLRERLAEAERRRSRLEGLLNNPLIAALM